MLHGINYILLPTLTQVHVPVFLNAHVDSQKTLKTRNVREKSKNLTRSKKMTPYLPHDSLPSGSVAFGHADDHQTLGKYSSFDTRKAGLAETVVTC